MHAELQRRLCTNSAHDRIVSSLAASACAAARRKLGQPAELPAPAVDRVMLLLQQAKFSSPDPGTPIAASLGQLLACMERGQVDLRSTTIARRCCCLAAGSAQPYSEVSPLHQRVRSQLSALQHQCRQAGVEPPVGQADVLLPAELLAGLQAAPAAGAARQLAAPSCHRTYLQQRCAYQCQRNTNLSAGSTPLAAEALHSILTHLIGTETMLSISVSGGR